MTVLLSLVPVLALLELFEDPLDEEAEDESGCELELLLECFESDETLLRFVESFLPASSSNRTLLTFPDTGA